VTTMRFDRQTNFAALSTFSDAHPSRLSFPRPALAWLKALHIVQQHGRKSGYSLVPDKQMDSITAAAMFLYHFTWATPNARNPIAE